ncbi:hypothetical protein AUI07_02590 [archaeon 13_2_20CM_2_53_6]|nr:MAG: hypothetical protein AUI07_02590 [archaeon 13_2_20CM_2_53_6]
MGPQKTRPLLLAVAFGLILVGSVLVLSSSVMSGSAGGCFFWPFPVILVCGAGADGAPYISIIVALSVVVLISFLTLLWMRRVAASSSNL